MTKDTIVAPSKDRQTRITINLDNSVLEYFKAQAGDTASYQRLINKALKEHIALARTEVK